MAVRSDDIAINTLIGAGSRINGDLRVSGFVRIDGDVQGNIETSGKIIISEKARIRGNVSAFSVIAGGVVQGNIIAQDSVYLFSSAVVFGDVVSRSLQAEADVLLHGYCFSLKNEDEYLEALARWKDMQVVEQKSYRRS